MSIDAKHAYRFGYLKSEQWKNVRLEALAREKGCCQICGEESISNDAHHVWYPTNIYETTERHLVIVCRACHDFIHAMLPDCKTNNEEEGLAAWLKLKNAIVAWRLSKTYLFGDNTELIGQPEGVKAIRKAYEALRASTNIQSARDLRTAYETLKREHLTLVESVADYQQKAGVTIPGAVLTRNRVEDPLRQIHNALNQVKLWADFYRDHIKAEKNTVDTNLERANENQNEAVLLNHFGHKNSKSE